MKNNAWNLLKIFKQCSSNTWIYEKHAEERPVHRVNVKEHTKELQKGQHSKNETKNIHI
jgi:hypothetical protein